MSGVVSRDAVKRLVAARLTIAMDFNQARTRDDWKRIMDELFKAIDELPAAPEVVR